MKKKGKELIRHVRSPPRQAPEEFSLPLQSSPPVGKWLPRCCVKTYTIAEEKQTVLLSSERSQCMRSVRSQPAEMTCRVHDQLFTFPDANKPYLWKTCRRGRKQSAWGQGFFLTDIYIFFKSRSCHSTIIFTFQRYLARTKTPDPSWHGDKFPLLQDRGLTVKQRGTVRAF